jgi:hypothetical protein
VLPIVVAQKRQLSNSYSQSTEKNIYISNRECNACNQKRVAGVVVCIRGLKKEKQFNTERTVIHSPSISSKTSAKKSTIELN